MATTFEVLYLGSVAALDPTEGNTSSENAASLIGVTFGSAGAPLAYGAQCVMSPVDISSGDPTAYDKDNTIANDTFSIDGGAPQTVDTVVIYNVTIHYTDGTPDATASLSLLQDTAGNLYLLPEYAAGADATALGAAPIESLTINSINADPSWAYADRVATDFLCFTEGTRILSAQGEVAVEALRAGDLVMTVDHGLQPLRWSFRTHHNWGRAAHDGKPILIGRGALGMGLPHRDLAVSPLHRILVPHPAHALGVLVPAKALTELPRVRQMQGRRAVAYVHLLFARHEVIFAQGLPTESLYPGQTALRRLRERECGVGHRFVLPAVGQEADYAPARPFLTLAQLRKTASVGALIWTPAHFASAGLKVVTAGAEAHCRPGAYVQGNSPISCAARLESVAENSPRGR